MSEIKMILFDIDGVITDGKKYENGSGNELKSISLKDLDAFQLLQDAGYKLGCISGEDTAFSRQFAQMKVLDYVKLGFNKKIDALNEIEEASHITANEICYIGDGKYDIPVLQRVGLAVCPGDAIAEVKKVSDICLKKNGGEGCIAELYTLLLKQSERNAFMLTEQNEMWSVCVQRIEEHRDVIAKIAMDNIYINSIEKAACIIIECYERKGHLFLCGNGGSAADAQHLAAEFVGRFYLERRALNAEALTVNTSVLTSLANDYDYNMIFARQLEANAVEGDVVIGITTSGTSDNILQAFSKAKELKMKTILMTGDISKYAPILGYTDCLLAVPSPNTPRIQEIHILTGHIICEIVEKNMMM